MEPMNNTPNMQPENAPQTSYTPEPAAMDTTPRKSGSAGPAIGAVIVILILVAGALYFWSTLPTSEPTATETTQVSDAYAAESQAAAASMSSLESDTSADLNALEQNF